MVKTTAFTMKKTERVNRIAERTNPSKQDAGASLDAAMAVIGEELKAGSSVQQIGFGIFSVRERTVREGRDSKT